MLISLEKKQQKKSKQFNFYGKLTDAKSNFDSNWIFSKFWFLYIYIYNLVSNGSHIAMLCYINNL